MSSKMVEMEDEGTRRFLSYSKKIIADIEEHRVSNVFNTVLLFRINQVYAFISCSTSIRILAFKKKKKNLRTYEYLK